MKAFLHSLGILTAEELNRIDPYLSYKTLRKGDLLIREGKICREVVFIRNGILRSYYNSPEGDEMTYCLTFQQSLMTALSSLITGEPTRENIQALTDVELEVISKQDLESLYETGANWTKVGKLLIEQQYVELEKRIFSFQQEKAKERYTDLIAHHPEYTRQIPLGYLASFLGITPRHLSRLRKEISG